MVLSFLQYLTLSQQCWWSSSFLGYDIMSITIIIY